jgi:hypothetical protein
LGFVPHVFRHQCIAIIFVATLLTWLIPLARTLFARHWLSRRGISRLSFSRRWFALPTMLAIAYFTWTNRVVIHAQWFLSLAAFERHLAAQPLNAAPGWIGLYRVTHIRTIVPGQVQFHIDPIFGIFSASSIFIEGKTPTPTGYPFEENLGNNWWMMWGPS